jgi:sterol-4alpha-carboxylate 3-dehydrogenase (decarboxylating)
VAGEKAVLSANSASLAVVALRPSGIFGEGDSVMVPTFVKQAKRGKMKYIIGNGKNVWDFTYVGNVAQAHVLVRVASDLRGAGRCRSPARAAQGMRAHECTRARHT